MNKQKFKNYQRIKRKRRTRKNVFGDAERPRLSVYRSLRHMYAQIIDDDLGQTIVSAGTLNKDFLHLGKSGGNKGAAGWIGEDLARKALALGIRQVRFDRNGYQYHGRVKALADAARKAGLIF